MFICITATDDHKEALVSERFGRCPFFAFYESEPPRYAFVPNPARNEASGAGIAAAQFVLSRRPHVLLSGEVGPNAEQILTAAGIQIRPLPSADITIEEAMRAFIENPQGISTNPAVRTISEDERKSRLALLAERARHLRQELAQILDEIDHLEKGE